jgi:cytochrome c
MSKALLPGIFLWPFLLISQVPDHPPRVKFIQPEKNFVSDWNALVPYSVEVADAEDGDSKYQEIQSAEVMVRLKYVESNAKAHAYAKQKAYGDTAGMNLMIVSNCFSCHGFKNKLAGPSFLDISKRYLHSDKNSHQMVNHIMKGSTGIWGKETMPSHPELTETMAGRMVKWILKYAEEPELNYFVGLQGMLPLNKPAANVRHGLFVVTAFYTDHGTLDSPNKKITGSDHIFIQMK